MKMTETKQYSNRRQIKAVRLTSRSAWTQNLMVETRGQYNCTLHVDINCILPKRMSHVCCFTPRVDSLSRPILRCPRQRKSPTRLLCTILCSSNPISTRHPLRFETNQMMAIISKEFLCYIRKEN